MKQEKEKREDQSPNKKTNTQKHKGGALRREIK
jgi:hypothetical protein